MTRPFGGAALLALALAGCGGGREAAASIPRERFVAANVALRSVPDSVGNAAALRQAALRKHRVDEKALKGFVAVHGRDAEYMAGVWREIAQKVDSAYERTLAASRGEEEDRPGDVPPSDSGDPRPSGSALSRLPPGVVGETRTIERPSEMPPPPPGVRGIPREVTERMRKRPVVRPGEPPRPERDPADARPRDVRPSQPIPPPRPDSAPRP